MLQLADTKKPRPANGSKPRGRPPQLGLLVELSSCDRALVLRAQSGDHGAFNGLVRKYRHRVMKLSMRYTRNRDDAEDAVQNTFIRAFWALRQFRGDSAFYSWLHRIAVNSAKTVLSLRARDASVFKTYAASEREGNEGPAELDTPEDLALTEEICSAVNGAIEALCEDQRTAIVLREFQGLSYSQIAAVMSSPVGTVRSRVFRAREAIDGRLRRVFDDGLGRARCDTQPGSRPTQPAGVQSAV